MRMNTTEKIDFVVLWVDGNDPAWLEERSHYLPQRADSGNSANRFRDWGLMQYWFRGVEKFAPWVNRVYFVTWGHCPQWLNTAHPKLKVVKHTDFIPAEYLPTFNSNTILLNLHRIPGLSEHFVLFNDDMFLTSPVTPEDFFRNGLPCESALLGQICAVGNDVFPYIRLNNSAVINSHFDKRTVLKTHFRKFFSPKYGKLLLQNFILGTTPLFSGFRDPHVSVSHLKGVFDTVWEAEPELLRDTCRNRFRSKEDVSEWLMKYWNLCTGHFVPRSAKWGRVFSLGTDDGWEDCIRRQRCKTVCLNDCAEDCDFHALAARACRAFETILPERSGFEQ